VADDSETDFARTRIAAVANEMTAEQKAMKLTQELLEKRPKK
jgi:hypothetical protein